MPTVGGTQATDYYALYSPYNPSGAPYYTPSRNGRRRPWATDGTRPSTGRIPTLYTGITTDQWLAAGTTACLAASGRRCLTTA